MYYARSKAEWIMISVFVQDTLLHCSDAVCFLTCAVGVRIKKYRYLI